jgi:hypothetical protein
MAMEAARARVRYNAMVEFNSAPALARRAVGIRLRAASASDASRAEVQTFVRNSASDAHARADALHGGTNLQWMA